MKHLIFILVAVISFASLFAQNNSSIPEINALPKNLPRSIYVDSLFRIAKNYKNIDALKSIAIFEQVIDSATKINYTKLIIKSNNIIGLIRAEQNQLAVAYGYHQVAFKLASKTSDSAEMAITYNYIGDTYKRLRLQEKGVEYCKKAVSIAQLMKDSSHIASFSDRVGHIYMDWAEETNKFDLYYEALKNYKYSLHINEKRNDLLRLSLSYVNLANAYIVMYKHGGDKTFLRQSISYSLKGQEFAKAGNHKLEWATNTLNLGEAYFQLGNLDVAMDYYKQSISDQNMLTNRLWHATVLVDMALVYEKKKEYDKAIELIEEANSITIQYDHVAPFSNYKYLAELYAEKNDYKAAYQANKKYHELLNRDVNTRTMLEMEGKQLELDIERKDKEIELLNKENKYNAEQHKKDIVINYVLIGFLVLLVTVLILVINRSRLLKKSKKLADKARIMQQQFLANTSHEIRTPMNGIIGMANQLEHTELNHEQKRVLQVIKKSANSLLSVINDVLDLSKIQAGKIEFRESMFLLDVFIDDIQKLLATQAAQKGLEFRFEIDSNLPEVLCGDDERLKQILINLLSNAIKFTENGTVSLKVQLQKQLKEKCYVKFEVADTGLGIHPKRQKDIFESFVQIEDIASRTQGGTGLGLSITKSLVELQSGTINLQSRLVEGSVFTVVIPFKTVGLDVFISECEKSVKALKAEKNLKNISVLVVEDNLVNQQVISKILERWGACYAIASSAVEGFDLLNEAAFDLVLMDIEMPGLNGWEATQYIRTKYTAPKNNIPILALTAYAYDSERQKCIESGMNDVLIKPYNEEELYLKIRELLYNEEYIAPVNQKNNVEELEQRYSDDQPALKELYELFLKEMPEYIVELKMLQVEGNVEALAKHAHKMKSPVSLFGSIETIGLLRLLNSKQDITESERNRIVIVVVKDCEQLIIEVQNKLKRIS